MKRSPVLVLVALALVACQEVSLARRGSPRVETEVVVAIDESVRAGLRDAGAEFDAMVEAIVLEQADVGLRFYPVISASYGPGQVRPAYLMSVRLQELAARAHEVTIADEPGRKKTVADDVTATVAASLEKRRDNAPSLLVGTGSSSYASAPRESSGDMMFLVNAAGDAVPIPRADVRTAIERALRKTLQDMVQAIDREAELMAAPPDGR